MRLTEFLKVFFPDENEPLYIFGFSPKELPEELKERPERMQVSRAILASDKPLQERLKKLNETMGLYFTVNSGGTQKEEIDRINAVFCEIDDLAIEDQHGIFDNCDYPPSIRVETKKSVHAYWLLEDRISVDDFIFIQRGLIERFKSDKALKNQNRVMRLPFFNHISFESGEYLYKQVQIHTFNPQNSFSLAELKSVYSPAPEQNWTPSFAAYPNASENGWEGVFRKLRERIEALPSYHVERAGKLASAQGICHNGNTNRTLVVNLETGKVFCRNECSFDQILNAFGIEKPIKQEKKIFIPRVAPRVQSSNLYKWLTEREQEKAEVVA